MENFLAQKILKNISTLGVILTPKGKIRFWAYPKNLPNFFGIFFYFWKVHELGFNLWVWFGVIPEIFLSLGPFEK